MRKNRCDYWIAIVTVILLLVGLIVIYAIGPMRANYMNAAFGTETDVNYYFKHQLLTVVAGLIVFFLAYKIPYEKVRKFAKVILLLGILACAALWVLSEMGSSLASCQNGACRWFNIGPIGFQPAEFLKLGLLLYLAQLTAERKREGKLETSDFWIPFVVMSGIALFFVIVVQSDLGTGVTMIMMLATILWMSGMKMKYLAIAAMVLLVGGALAILTSAHRMERVMTFFSSEGADTYHIENAQMAIGTGGLFGVGIGNSVQATGYLPESINDSVFAVMGETFGFVGLMLILAVFVVLLLRILKAAETAADDEQGFIAAGAFAWVATHLVVNIAAMTGLIPLTGITLPLLSYGGTSMLFICAVLGLVLQISCYTKREVKNESISSRRGIRGTYYSGRRDGA